MGQKVCFSFVNQTGGSLVDDPRIQRRVRSAAARYARRRQKLVKEEAKGKSIAPPEANNVNSLNEECSKSLLLDYGTRKVAFKSPHCAGPYTKDTEQNPHWATNFDAHDCGSIINEDSTTRQPRLETCCDPSSCMESPKSAFRVEIYSDICPPSEYKSPYSSLSSHDGSGTISSSLGATPFGSMREYTIINYR